jgi:DNA replication protein DnaC
VNSERSEPTSIGDVIADSISVERDPISRALSEEYASAFRERRQPRTEEDMLAEFPEQEVAEWRERIEQMEEARQDRLREKEVARVQVQIERRISSAQIPALYHESFDELDHTQNPLAFTACQELAEKGQYYGRQGVILSGDSGNGKTTLAAATLRRFIQRTKGMFPARFWPIIQALQSQQDSFGEADRERISELYDCHFVVLDDLGKRRLKEWPSEVLFSVIDSLYSNNRILIITTNWTADKMFEELDYSLASRLHAMCKEIILNSHDYRLAL